MLIFEWDPSKLSVPEKLPAKKGSIMKVMLSDAEMLEEYNFSKAVRGKYAHRYAIGSNVVVIDADIAKYFPDHDSVNEALRSLADIMKKHEKKMVDASNPEGIN